MDAIQVSQTGPAEVLELVELEPSAPAQGELRISVEAIGVNYADIKRRQGVSRRSSEVPFVPGIEVAGTVDIVGAGVPHSPGDRVVAYLRKGGYAESVVTESQSVFEIPPTVSFNEAAGGFIQFVTAASSLQQCAQLEAGESVLVHGAAGGVGSSAVQLADQIGATVFATASSEEKLNFTDRLGADHLINYQEENFADVVDRLTDGKGVDVVLDGVGGVTFERSIDALSEFGRIVSIGCVNGNEGCPDLSIVRLKRISVMGYHLGTTVETDPEQVHAGAESVLSAVGSQDVEVQIDETFSLAEAEHAHEYLESRRSMGKLLLMP